MKKSVILLVMIITAAAVFATGAQEADDDGVVELRPGELQKNAWLQGLDEVELTGSIVFESPVPELRSGGKDYTLTAPGAMGLVAYLEEGQRVTVKGYILDAENQAFNGPGRAFGGRGGMMNGPEGSMPGIQALEGNTTVLVESVTIDGVVYELPWVNGGFADAGMRRSGMMRGDFDDDDFGNYRDRSSRRPNFN